MGKRWKKEELTYLKRYAKQRKVEELAERFRTDAEEIKEKLVELGLTARDSVPVLRIENNPLMPVYEQGLKAVYKGKWSEAITRFGKVIAESDQPELVDRAREYKVSAERRKAAEASPEKFEDAYLEAVFLKNQGDMEQAQEICSRGGRQGKDERFAYLAGAICAVTGDFAAAAELLEQAIDLNPKNRVHAYHDPDFSELKDDQEYSSLFAASE